MLGGGMEEDPFRMTTTARNVSTDGTDRTTRSTCCSTADMIASSSSSSSSSTTSAATR